MIKVVELIFIIEDGTEWEKDLRCQCHKSEEKLIRLFEKWKFRKFDKKEFDYDASFSGWIRTLNLLHGHLIDNSLHQTLPSYLQTKISFQNCVK